jgi:hypothetical protein
MPCLNDYSSILLCKFLRASQFADFHAGRFPKLHTLFNIKDRFTAALADVNVNRSMIVAVESKLKAIFLENLGHTITVTEADAGGNILLPIVRDQRPLTVGATGAGSEATKHLA